uniref:Major facilitator superfamily (MFS) profile domain-containing protein n=1 Tax=Bionectria ochroleuca TaxID=29856 RepID=A0A8H7K642_BIOOC
MAAQATEDRKSIESKQYPLLKDKPVKERDALNKKLLRKLDFFFLPCVTLMLIMCFLDRINVSNARLTGMQKDLHMTDTQWSAGISMFYVGHLISQLPGNVILARGNPRILLPPLELHICRFLVGFFEGPFTPAVSLMTSSWYTKNESPLRMAIWHAGNNLSNVISGLLAAAILTKMHNVGSISAWQWFILIEGVASIIIAVSAFWFIPKWPHNTGTYYLTAEESAMAQFQDDEGGRWAGIVMAAKDPFTWMFTVLHFFVIMAQSFKDFFPSIMATFGFGTTETYLLQAPPYMIAFISCCVVSWSSGRVLEYFWHMTAAMLVGLAGTVVMISTLQQAARYFSLFLLCSGPFIALNLQLSWETTVVPRPHTKRAALVAIANKPRYETGGGSIIAASGASVIVLIIIRWYIAKKNKQLIKRQEETGEISTWRYTS